MFTWGMSLPKELVLRRRGETAGIWQNTLEAEHEDSCFSVAEKQTQTYSRKTYHFVSYVGYKDPSGEVGVRNGVGGELRHAQWEHVRVLAGQREVICLEGRICVALGTVELTLYDTNHNMLGLSETKISLIAAILARILTWIANPYLEVYYQILRVLRSDVHCVSRTSVWCIHNIHVRQAEVALPWSPAPGWQSPQGGSWREGRPKPDQNQPERRLVDHKQHRRHHLQINIWHSEQD